MTEKYIRIDISHKDDYKTSHFCKSVEDLARRISLALEQNYPFKLTAVRFEIDPKDCLFTHQYYPMSADQKDKIFGE